MHVGIRLGHSLLSDDSPAQGREVVREDLLQSLSVGAAVVDGGGLGHAQDVVGELGSQRFPWKSSLWAVRR